MAISAGNVPAESDPQDLQYMESPRRIEAGRGPLHLRHTISGGSGVCKSFQALPRNSLLRGLFDPPLCTRDIN